MKDTNEIEKQLQRKADDYLEQVKSFKYGFQNQT